MTETVCDYYRRLLSSEDADELEGAKDDMRSTAPWSVKYKAQTRIKVLTEKAEAVRAAQEGAPDQPNRHIRRGTNR